MPDWKPDILRRLAASPRLDPAREAEIVEELSQHLDEYYDDLRRGGVADVEARRLAVEELLEPEALANALRPLRQANVHPQPVVLGATPQSLLRDLGQDLRYAARTQRRQPGFALAVILTLALGIGVNSAIFALVDATLLRPLPFPDPERLVMVWERTQTTSRAHVAPLNLVDWNERNRTFDRIAGFTPNVGGMVMAGADGTAETVSRQWITAGLFDVLGVKAIVGRTFLPTDDVQRASVVVLSEAFWRTRFGADPAIVGRDLRLDGSPWTVVGVVPNDAQLLPTSLWAMRSIQGAPPAARGFYGLRAIGRLKPGVTLDAAGADLGSVAEGLAREFPDTNKGRSVALEPLHDAVIGGELRHTSALFLGVVGFVLLICCANVASLLLTRATARTRELAIRSALGADRARVVRQLVTESVLLSAIGGVLGLLVGVAVLQAAPALIPPGLLPATVTLTFDVRVAAFCAAAALLVGLLSGLAPAWRTTELASAEGLASDSRTATAHGAGFRSVLVAGQVAMAVLLLVGAGLLLRTLLAVEGVDRGYRADGALTMILDPIDSRYPDDAAELRFYEAVGQEVAALPGVRGVAWATTLPLGRSYFGRYFFEIAGEPVDDRQRPTADYQIVSPTYFRTLELPIVAGRPFDDRDTPQGPPVCIVNEAFVRAHVGGRSPLGLRVALRSPASARPVVREIVGVARQIKGRPDEVEAFVQVYVPLAQDTPGDIFLLVRPASGSAETLAPPVRAAIARVDKEQLVSVRSVMTLGDVAREATGRHRFRAVLVVAFAGLALLLAMVGLFGVLAYSVQQRVREFAVRRTLGATTKDVLGLVGGSAARVTAAGAVLGLGLSAVLGRLLATMLFGVRPLDAVTFAVVTMVLALTAAVAAAVPAWRAARVDPAVALRAQ
jgi:putative ABC transport system permease protein